MSGLRAAGQPITGAASPPRSGVKAGLTPRRRRRIVENDEYALFAGRVLRSYGRRVAAGDIEALGSLAVLAGQVDEVIGQAVSGLRAQGHSWAEIGARLGVTRQAVQQRWGEREEKAS